MYFFIIQTQLNQQNKQLRTFPLLQRNISKKPMSSTSRAWIAAACIGVVEALKDQGVCRWNSTLRSIQHHTKANLRSYSHAKKIPTSQYLSNNFRNDKLKQSEESLRTVMYLSCWGPNN
ncbi:uncharacterized protein LOC115724515 [Cannabis sativa]|uniref:uncharacterized protein LOC115724515 n=1 Tax=Cannabis sativa TaxID=3483 RepID=UPI0011DF0608|nr:uncharacterized protein LOC115724515 [Cannabis sativa]